MISTRSSMNGFDAYENAFDILAKHLKSVIYFNLVWMAGFVALIFLLFLLTVSVFKSWIAFCFFALLIFLVFGPLWEGANILRYSDGRQLGASANTLPVVRIILTRLLFLLLVIPAYLFFILPGIYLHCRFALYLPLLIYSPKLSPVASLAQSWSITRCRFIAIYTLWIVVVVSKPICLLPFGLGFLLERPACGLAKNLMCSFYSNPPLDEHV